MTSQERAFHEFADFVAKLNGDEKGAAKIFLIEFDNAIYGVCNR